MSNAETLQRPTEAIGSVRIHRHLSTLRRKETESKERKGATQATASVTAVQRECGKALEADANALLGESSYHAIRRVSCEACDSVIILSGRVPTYYMKQIAQTIVLHLLEDKWGIDNQVEVDRT